MSVYTPKPDISRPRCNVRFGSKADVTLFNFDVRFTPNSGHPSAQSKCPLWANSRLMQCSNECCYSITSSAATSRFCGMVRPSTLVVFKLMTRSNFVGCITGRSAGFSPLRTRPVSTPACRYPLAILGGIRANYRSLAPMADLHCVIRAVEGLVMLHRRPVFGVPIMIIPVADASWHGRSRGCQAPNPHQPQRRPLSASVALRESHPLHKLLQSLRERGVHQGQT
jgi:hypothetical protein